MSKFTDMYDSFMNSIVPKLEESYDSVELKVNLGDETFSFILKKGKKKKEVLLTTEQADKLMDNEVDDEFIELIDKSFKAK